MCIRDRYYFSADSFIEEMRAIQFTGSCQCAYHYVASCTDVYKRQPPEYETKTGRKKKRNSVIGVLHGNKNTLTGIKMCIRDRVCCHLYEAG